ncbi:MAG: oligopeptide transporter, OPT family, partial [Nitrospiraceae bacterium]
WGAHIRYVGIGAMLVGGLWTLVQLRRPVLESLRSLRAAYRMTPVLAHHHSNPIPRTERDASLPWIVIPVVLSLFPMALIYAGVVERWNVALVMTVVMTSAAFLFSAVAAYMAGLVGSSSNPVSGVTIATIMLAALLLVVFMGR